MVDTCVVVGAHPDDESLFWGGRIVKMAQWSWDVTVICCSVPIRDPIRSWKFFDACAVLGVTGKLLPFQEPHPTQGFDPEMLKLLDLEPYDRIVTHGVEGGYGHPHHVQLHHYIHHTYPHKEILSDCPPGKLDFGVEVRLTPAELARKMQALRCYDHVLPYVTRDGRAVSWIKAEALLDRYCYEGGWDLGLERYRTSRPPP